MTPDQASLLRGRRYNRAKKAEGRPKKLGQIDPVSGETSARLAKQHGVSARTIKRDAKKAEFVARLEARLDKYSGTAWIYSALDRFNPRESMQYQIFFDVADADAVVIESLNDHAEIPIGRN